MTEKNPNLKNLRTKAMSLPLQPGVYLMKNKDGQIIYVGKAKILKNRVSQYFGSDKNHGEKVIQMVLMVKDFDFIITDSEFEALILENSLIKQNQPKYNILLKDDKGYSYIKISKAPWSKITQVKQVLKDDAKYFGPYVSAWTVKNIVEQANDIFKLPRCTKVFPRDFRKSRPCLNFYIKKCSAVCTGKISHEDYEKNINEATEFIKNGGQGSVAQIKAEMENAAENLDFERAAVLRDRMNAIIAFKEKQKVVQSKIASQDVIGVAEFDKNTVVAILKFRNNRLCDIQEFVLEQLSSVEELLQDFIKAYYQNHEIPPRITLGYEIDEKQIIERWLSEKSQKKVVIFKPVKGEQLALLEMCNKNATEKMAQLNNLKGREVSALEQIQKLLNLENTPKYIESYDISNMAGQENVAGMVVFENGRPLKKAYKRFKIKTVAGQDDYGSMKEVINRRFDEYEKLKDTGEGFGKLPDLILLDGGKGHVASVLPIIKSRNLNVAVYGMVKDHKHKTRAIAVDGGEIDIKSTQKAFNLISSIQDEVHRFAITYHRNLRSKRSLSSKLLEIDTVGAKKAEILLKHFKTMKNIETASLEELKKVQGISSQNAIKIIEYFTND
ncbi:MAG: excinuclease ABC subunit UvrC [Clostridia bacterium]